MIAHIYIFAITVDADIMDSLFAGSTIEIFIVMWVSSLSRPKIYIEQKALDTIAYLCDGDARTGLNSLQLAVQAQVSSTQPRLLAQNGSPQEILVKEEHIKEGLQRSHILYDKAGKSRCTHSAAAVTQRSEPQGCERRGPEFFTVLTVTTPIQLFSVVIEVLLMMAYNIFNKNTFY